MVFGCGFPADADKACDFLSFFPVCFNTRTEPDGAGVFAAAVAAFVAAFVSKNLIVPWSLDCWTVVYLIVDGVVSFTVIQLAVVFVVAVVVVIVPVVLVPVGVDDDDDSDQVDNGDDGDDDNESNREGLMSL